MAGEISLEITEIINTVEVTEDVTSINLSPNVTTIELKGISIAQGFSSTATTYDGSSNTLGYGTSVSTALDHINTKGVSINKINTMEYDSKINFTAAGQGQDVYTAMNLGNNDIVGINRLKINDAGQREGVTWPNWGIFESPIPLSNNPGNFIVAHQYAENEFNPILEVKTDGIDVTGTITFDGGTTSANLNFGDGDKAVFGNSSDLQVYHSGDHSYITDVGEGNLYIDAREFYVRNDAGVLFQSTSAGSSHMLYADNTKLATTNSGVDVTGNLSVSGQLGVGTIDTSRQLHIKGSGSTVAVMVEATDGVQSSLDLKNSEGQFRIINDSGELSIYDQTDNTERFRIDTNGNVGIGTNNPSTALDVNGTITFDGGTTSNTFNVNSNLNVTGTAEVSHLRVERDNGTAVVTLHDSTDDDDHVIYLTGLVDGVGGPQNIFSLGTNDNTNQFQMHSWQNRDFEFTFGSNKHVDAVATISTSGLDVAGTVTATTFSGDLNGTINTATTATTQAATDNSTKVATTAYVKTAVSNLVDGSPAALDTLNELASALGDDANFSTTVTNSIGTKLAKDSNLSDLTNAATARTNLGLGTAATINFDGEYASLNNKPTLVTALSGLSDVDATTNLADGKILKYSGTDSEWQVADDAGGIALTDISVNGTEGTASGDGGISYDNTTGVFTYTPPDLSNVGKFQGGPTVEFNWNGTAYGTYSHTAGEIQPSHLDYTANDFTLKVSNTTSGSKDVTEFIRKVSSCNDTGENFTFLSITNVEDPTRSSLFKCGATDISNADYTSIPLTLVDGIEGGSDVASGITGSTTNTKVRLSFVTSNVGNIDILENLQIDSSTYGALRDTSTKVLHYVSDVSGNVFNEIRWLSPTEYTLQLGTDSTTALAGDSSIRALSDVSSSLAPGSGSVLAYNSAASEYQPYLLNDVAEIENQYIEVSTGAGVVANKPYYASAYDGANNRPIVALTDADNQQPCIGIATETVGSGSATKLLTKGIIRNIDTTTTAYPGTGNLLYISSNQGQLTRTAPVAYQKNLQQVATVLSTNATTGAILVDITASQVGVANLAEGYIAYGGANGEQTALYDDVSLPIRASAGPSGSREYWNVLRLTDANNNYTGDINHIQIGQAEADEDSQLVDKISLFPGANGVRIHNSEAIGTEGISGQTLAFHTTDDGIHVGNDRRGTYTAGDLMVNDDTDFGMLVGSQSNNYGRNNFGFGFDIDFASDTNENFSTGARNTVKSNVSDSVSFGTSNELGSGSLPAVTSMFGGGFLTKTTDDYGFTWGYGYSNNVDTELFATNDAKGGVLFGQQSILTSNAINSFVGGGIGGNSENFEPHRVDSEHCFNYGKSNNIKGASHRSGAIGLYHIINASTQSFAAGEIQRITNTRASTAVGALHVVGDTNHDSNYLFAAGYKNEPLGDGAACIGYELKTPLNRATSNDDYEWEDYCTVVGGFNDPAKKFDTDEGVGATWVQNQRFVVGTGTSGSKKTGFVVAAPTADFSGIIMTHLAESTSHATPADARDAGVPTGGLYRTGNDVKILLATD